MNRTVLGIEDNLRLSDEAEACEALNIPLHLFRRMRRRHLFPVIRLGYRSYRYDVAEIRAALNKLRIKAVA